MRHVTLLTIDALRRDVLGCYGSEQGLTPFMDSIRDKSTVFTKAHSIGPYTQASFPGILTSSYYLEYRDQERREDALSWKRTLVSEVLHEQGITTAGFHSNPYLGEVFGWNRGWDRFDDSMEDEVDETVPYLNSSRINKKVDAWLSSQIGSTETKGTFLWVHYMDVHEPYVPAKEYIDGVDPTIDLSRDGMLWLFENKLLKRDASEKKDVELLRKLYWAHVREVDDAVREFFGILKGKNLLEDSVIILTSDHGDEFGEHGGLSHDGKMYSELVDVPLIIYEPGRDAARVTDKLVTTLDIPPTIVHLFGLDPVQAFEGSSLLPLENYPEKGVFGEAVDKHGSHEKGEEKGVHYYREGDLKMIYRERDDVWELYDLASDPREIRNIVHESPRAEAMMEKMRPRVSRNRS